MKKYNNTVQSSIKMKPKDVVHNRNIIKVYNTLYENYKPIYPFYKFDRGNKVRIIKSKTFEIGYNQTGLKKICFSKLKGYNERFNTWVKLFELKKLN